MKLFALLPVMLLVSCVYHVDLSESSDATEFARADELLRDRNATLRLVDSTKIIANNFRFYPDSLVYAIFKTGGYHRLPSDSVHSVVAIDQWAGARQGAWIGAIPGSILGSVIAAHFVRIGQQCDGCSGKASKWAVLYGTGIGAAFGAGFGAAFGAGSAPRYIVNYTPRYP